MISIASFVALAVVGQAPPVPAWIWTEKAGDKQQLFLRKTFDLPGGVKSAKLVASCDNEMIVWIDGKEACRSKEWEYPEVVDAAGLFDAKSTKHVVAVRATNNGGPAGFAATLQIESATGAKTTVVTDTTWLSADRGGRGWQGIRFDAKEWKPVAKIADLGGGSWKSITPERFANAKPRREPSATPAELLKTLPGFKAELLHTTKSKTEGSWVNMCVDPRGRLIVSDQYGGLFRVTPPPVGQSSGTQVEKIDVPLGEAQGLLWAFDSLYVVVNKGGKYESGLYRVKDTNGDDRLDKVEKLWALEGGGEHGPHAVLLNPDGKSLTVVCGNGTALTKIADSTVPRRWQEDHLLPRVPDGNGFMKNVGPPGGCIYRVDPDGKKWTLVSMGYRNEFDAAYNERGDLFTYDADMEWDVNTPWYRPTRVCLVASGSEYGWRNGAGKWPPYYLDSLPPVVEIGPGSPTGVCFGFGAKFPAKYQTAFFIADWSYGVMYAVHLTPKGASYTATTEEFLRGSPLPLTDMVISPSDGAMYAAIGGRKTTSALYRVTYVGTDSIARAPATALDPAAELRRKLESYHTPKAPSAEVLETAWPALGHEDRFVRFAARVALEHQPVKSWQTKALTETDPTAGITALCALARCGEKAVQPQLLAALDRFEWKSLSHERRLDLLRVYHLAFTRFGKPSKEAAEKLAAKFDALFPAAERAENIEMFNLLVYLGAPSAPVKGLAQLASAPTQEEEIDFARALRMAKVGWTPELRKRYFEWFKRATNFKGGHSLAGFMKLIRADAIASLTKEEQVALKAVIDAPLVAEAPQFKPRPFVKKWTLDELVPALESKLANRDYARGRRLFAEAKCFACHRFAFEGGSAGPDLTGIAGRFSKRDLLESIIDPNKTISDQYAAVTILTDDGRTVAGRIVNHSGASMMIVTDMMNPDGMVNVDARRIETIQPSKTSMMPVGLLDTLTEDEVLDLTAFLLSRGNRSDAMFKAAGVSKRQ